MTAACRATPSRYASWYAPIRSADDIDTTPLPARVVNVKPARIGGLRQLFDVYAREGQTSLAVRLEFRAPDSTLTDEDVARRRENIVAAVADELGGRLRG